MSKVWYWDLVNLLIHATWIALPLSNTWESSTPVTKVNRVDVGFRPASDSGRSSGRKCTRRKLNVNWGWKHCRYKLLSFWVIKDAGKFLFNIQSPVETVKATSETAMREVIAKNEIQTILTEGRSNIEEVQKLLKKY